MTYLTKGHGVSWCFGTSLAPIALICSLRKPQIRMLLTWTLMGLVCPVLVAARSSRNPWSRSELEQVGSG